MSSHRYGRRSFLKKTAAASAAITFSGKMAPAASAPAPLLVSLTGKGIAADLDAALSKLLAPWGGMQAFVSKGQSVLLKPNMGFPTPPQVRATTSPQLVAAVAKQALACGAGRVTIIDNPVRRPEACLRVNGIRKAIKGLDVHILMPTSDKLYRSTLVPKGKSLKKVAIVKEALEADVHIALPIAKSHNAAGYTGTLKGMMGLILDRESFHARYDLNQAIADLNTVLIPKLSILDGLQVMTTDGPAGPGELVTCNTLVAGTDPVAVDAAGVELTPLYGRAIKPHQVKHLKFAQQMQLGTLSPPAERVQRLTF